MDGLLLWVQNQLNRVAINKINIAVEDELNLTISSCQAQADEKHITIRSAYNGPKTAFADAHMFKAINRNLLINAIKFSAEHSEIVVQTHQEENDIVISFIDHGTGMNAETISNIETGIFSKPSFGTKGEKGVGLGLSLCKDFIEKNNGKLHINSKVNAGSNFSYSLPAVLT